MNSLQNVIDCIETLFRNNSQLKSDRLSTYCLQELSKDYYIYIYNIIYLHLCSVVNTNKQCMLGGSDSYTKGR